MYSSGPAATAKARTCAPRGRGVGRWGPTSGRVGFGAQPRLGKDCRIAASFHGNAYRAWHLVVTQEPGLIWYPSAVSSRCTS